MAITNQERVGKAMDLLRQGLAPFVDREVQQAVKSAGMRMDTIRRFAEDPALSQRPILEWDVAGLLKLMWETPNRIHASAGCISILLALAYMYEHTEGAPDYQGRSGGRQRTSAGSAGGSGGLV